MYIRPEFAPLFNSKWMTAARLSHFTVLTLRQFVSDRISKLYAAVATAKWRGHVRLLRTQLVGDGKKFGADCLIRLDRSVAPYNRLPPQIFYGWLGFGGWSEQAPAAWLAIRMMRGQRTNR